MVRLFQFVLNHPLCRGHRWSALRRVVSWQAASRILPAPMAVPFTSKTWLLMERGAHGATGNFYCGLHECDDMAFVLNFLRPGDLFVDVGANIGSYTILAAGHVGATSVALEPVPSTFQRLRANVRYNNLDDRVTLLNCGAGDTDGQLRFTAALDTVNHVATDRDRDFSTVSVPVARLDRVLAHEQPLCIKIDVEGFEKKVLDGARVVLQTPSLRAVLLELNGSGERYGLSDDQVNQDMLSHGFQPYRYTALTGRLQRLEGRNYDLGNTLYLRDLPFVLNRLSTAAPIELPWRVVHCPPVEVSCTVESSRGESMRLGS